MCNFNVKQRSYIWTQRTVYKEAQEIFKVEEQREMTISGWKIRKSICWHVWRLHSSSARLLKLWKKTYVFFASCTCLGGSIEKQGRWQHLNSMMFQVISPITFVTFVFQNMFCFIFEKSLSDCTEYTANIYM